MNRNYSELLKEVKGIAEKYELDTKSIECALTEEADFKVTAPLVGAFSSGKSSLINAVLGEKILSTNISPETAVPTEIMYGNDEVVLVTGEGEESTCTIETFDPSVLSVNRYSLVKIKTKNEFFREISSIKLVDMPGFDSGIEMHNRAIDDYMPKSLAYILAIEAADGTLQNSVVEFLNELKLHDIPVYAVLTKMREVLPEELDAVKEQISIAISDFLQTEAVNVVATEARKKPIQVDGFKEILVELQARSKEIYNKYFDGVLTAICNDMMNYLTNRLNQSDMSLEEIELEREQISKRLQELEMNFEQKQNDFYDQLNRCIEVIQYKVEMEMENSASLLQSMLLQGTDITEKVNSIVRRAVTTGIRTEIEPKIQKYMKQINAIVDAGVFGDVSIRLDDKKREQDDKLEGGLQSLAAPLGTGIASLVGSGLASTLSGTKIGTMLGSALGPVGAAIGAVLGTLLSVGISNSMRKKQEREREEIARQKVREIISSVSTEVCGKVGQEILDHIEDLNDTIREEIQSKREVLEKSLRDTEEKLRSQRSEKDAAIQMLQRDLEVVKEIRDGK